MIFAKHLQKAFQIQKLFKEHQVRKIYVAKVHGKFSTEDVNVNVPLQRLNIRKGIWRIAKPNILSNDHESKLNNENVIIKTAETNFKFISYDKDNNTSNVLCFPKTGRTHQLREHLRYLNHSIVNDEEIQKLKEYVPR